MKISKNGIDLIKKWEGCFLKAYQDIVGVWTIGYGTTNYDTNITGVTIKQGMIISRETALDWLEKSLNNRYVPLVEKYQKIYNFNQNEFDALVSFAYNIGSIEQLTNNGRRSKEEIKQHFLAYCKAGGKVIQGLLNRRQDELNLFNKPCSIVPEPENSNKSIDELAHEVIEGKFGNGEERKKNLGDRYNEVQEKVNELLAPKIEYYKKCDSNEKSIVDALKKIDVDSSKENRKRIAKKNGISNYSGSGSQNLKLLKLLKEGKLIK